MFVAAILVALAVVSVVVVAFGVADEQVADIASIPRSLPCRCCPICRRWSA